MLSLATFKTNKICVQFDLEKEDELKGLKSELATLERKIQLELSKDKEPQQQQAVANGANQTTEQEDANSMKPPSTIHRHI